MKNRKFVRLSALVLSCLMLITLFSCHLLKSKGDKKMSISIKISIPDALISMVIHKKDSVFQKSMALALATQKHSTDDFLILFGKAWEQYAARRSLNTAFTFSSESMISNTSTTDEAIQELSKMTEKLIDQSLLTIENRMKGMDVKVVQVKKTNQRGEITLLLEDVEFPERVLHLIEFAGNLVFWETFEYVELYPFIEKVDKYMAQLMNPEDKAASGSKPKDKSADTNEFGLPKEHSFDEYAQDHPLIVYLQPALIQDDAGNYYPNKGPCVGYCLIKDTARVNAILRRPEIKVLLPPSLQLAWTIAPADDKKTTLRLIALKENYYGGPALSAQNYVTDAKWSVGQNQGNEIEIEMNSEGAQIWKRVTSNNIGKSIAIVMDGYVYSFPTVQAEIGGGKSVISGNFTVDEAKDLASIFKTGGLPAHITVTGVQVFDKTGKAITSDR